VRRIWSSISRRPKTRRYSFPLPLNLLLTLTHLAAIEKLQEEAEERGNPVRGGCRVDSPSRGIDLSRRSFCQGSSVVEQGTHKPLVGSSNLPPGISIWLGSTFCGSSSRHYIGSAVDLNARLAQHRRGHTCTTKRLGERLEAVASKQIVTLDEARSIDRPLKAKKNPRLAIRYLQRQSSE
jgi:predicted GIY-YIG superfamily endonuclease